MSHDVFAPVTAAPVIVGYNGTPESSDALALGLELAAVLETPVLAVSVLTSAPLEVVMRSTYAADLSEQGERLVAMARRQAGQAEIETLTVLAPSPARELDRIAGERAARVLVVGSTHRGALRRVVPGTVANRLMAAGASPVAIAPRGFDADFSLNTVGVGFDGSAESRLALAQAVGLARSANASIDLITAVDPHAPVDVAEAAPGYPGLDAAPRVARQAVDRARSTASTTVRELVPAEVRATLHVVEEDPAIALSERSEDLDLLVLGSRGRGPVGRVLLGSASAVVSRHSRCPVLVTPRPEDAPAEGADAAPFGETASAGDGAQTSP